MSKHNNVRTSQRGRNSISAEAAIVIAAAVATVIGQHAHIKRIRLRKRPPEMAWATQGRVAIMVSHLPKS